MATLGFSDSTKGESSKSENKKKSKKPQKETIEGEDDIVSAPIPDFNDTIADRLPKNEIDELFTSENKKNKRTHSASVATDSLVVSVKNKTKKKYLLNSFLLFLFTNISPLFFFSLYSLLQLQLTQLNLQKNSEKSIKKLKWIWMIFLMLLLKQREINQVVKTKRLVRLQLLLLNQALNLNPSSL